MEDAVLMPVEVLGWEDFKSVTAESTRFIYNVDEAGDSANYKIATTQFFIVVTASKSSPQLEDVQRFLQEKRALRVGKSKRWEEVF